MKLKLEELMSFINNGESRWRAFIVSDFPVLEAQAKTIYIKINKDTIKNKQKKAEVIFFYVDTDIKDGQLNFREAVFKFINSLKDNFEERDCRAIENAYSIKYETFNNDKYNLSVAEIVATYDYTTLKKDRDSQENSKLMNILAWDIDMK